MGKAKYVLSILILSTGLCVSAATGNLVGNTAGINLENPLIAVSAPAPTRNYIPVQPLDMVKNPSFYLNKYVGVKFNGSYVWVGEGCNSFYDKDFFLAQARVQYVF